MLRFRISNMNCGGCAKGVAASLLKADPAAQVSFDLDRKEATLISPSLDAAVAERVLLADGWTAERLPA